MLNILHMLSNQLIPLEDVRVAVTKDFVRIQLAIRALGSSNQLAESFKGAPQGWLQVQGLLIALNRHFLFELLFQDEAKQVVASSPIWDVHVLVKVQVIVRELVTWISTILG